MTLNTEFKTNLKKAEAGLNVFIAMRTILVLVAVFVCFTSCFTAGIKLPEHIYKRPSYNLSRDTAIGVFRFWSPEYVPGSGYAAATMFYKELLERGFSNVAAEIDVHDIRLDNIMEIAERKNYKLIITGEVSYYISGSEVQESRVDEQIKAIDVLTRKTVWHAEVIEIGRPVYRVDYIFFSTKGKEAPSPAVLMGRNARKFCNMFLTVPEEHESLSEDMRLVNDGDNYLVTKEYEKAKSLFEKALEINPDNGYALFNLGLVHERQGNKEEAIKMYQKVIALNIDATDKESNDPIKMGQSLVVLAKEHIANLEK